MTIHQFNFTLDKDFKVTVTAKPGATQPAAARALTVLTRMRRALEDLRDTLPLN